jgi:hypothetical protein
MKRKLFVYLLIAIIVLSCVMTFQLRTVTATGWLTGWSYRKSHVINAAKDAGTNYQIKITVHYGSGTDTSGDVYLNGKCRTDFGDIRFTDDDGITLLDYWIENSMTKDARITKPIQANWIASDRTVYAGMIEDTNGIIRKSADEGQTWSSPLLTISGVSEIELVYVTANGYIYVSMCGSGMSSSNAGLWRSIDNGQNWTRVLSLDTVNEVFWGFDEDSNGNLFAGVYTLKDTANARIYKSTNNGASWTNIYYDSTARHIHDVKVDKSNNYIYATVGDDFNPYYTKNVLRSTNGGSSWSQILSDMPQCVAICITPTARLFGSDTDGGTLYRTTDDSTYTTTLNTVSSANVFWIRRDPAKNKTYAALIAGNDTPIARIYVSEDDGVAWSIFKTLNASVALDGSYYGSNFVDGTMYYSVTENAVWKNGTQLYSESVTCWVEVADDLSANPLTIYTYYGKSDAATTSNGYATFPFFEDFESGGASSWNVYAIGSGKVSVSSTQANGAYSLMVNKPSGTTNVAAASQQISATGIVQFKFGLKFFQQGSISSTWGYHLLAFQASENAQNPTWVGAHVSHFSAGNVIQYYSNGWQSTTGQTTQNSWNSLLVTHTSSSFSLIVNNVAKGTYNNLNNNPVQAVHLGCQVDGYGGAEIGDFDDLFLAKFVNPEPIQGVWGSEEIGDYVIIDQTCVSDGRADVCSVQTVGIHAKWGNNGSDIIGGTIYVNNTSYVTNSSGWINISVTSPVVGRTTWVVTQVNCNRVTAYTQSAPPPSIVWDQIKIIDGNITEESVTLGETVMIWFKALYEYDADVFDLTSGILYVNGSVMSWSTAANRWEYNYTATNAGTKTFVIEGIFDNSYNLTNINDTVGVQVVNVWSSQFSIISNSTLSDLVFNSTNKTLSFTVSGPSGTQGYTNVTIAKTLIENISQLEVYLDGNQINYTATSTDFTWVIHFTYPHSTHKVVITSSSPHAESSIETPMCIATALNSIVIAMLALILIVIKARQHHESKSNNAVSDRFHQKNYCKSKEAKNGKLARKVTRAIE